jgi:pyruvate/2-oxoglutarate/acetoin dehydrogenase E1 component/TPP-dependent pyruvate/acetoin dehydrogenase alpha subunit
MTDNLELDIMLDAHPSTDNSIDSFADAVKNYIDEVLRDYELCVLSRDISLIGRREVLTGKGKFGIFGDGKETAQVALARTFKKGDWRAGYYRDQTLMFALGVSTPEEFFAQLYSDCENDPFSGGRQMVSHFATANVDKKTGEWTNQKDTYNMSSDISATAGQMARAVGLALASKKYRQMPELRHSTPFSENGDEVCFCTIGDASTSEGAFFETINAVAVMRVPLAIFIWDDGYGISVPTELQTAKGSISEALRGFEMDENGNGIHIYTCKAWDYAAMCEIFEEGVEKTRRTHIPSVFHVQEMTQPQGHSTSGSHERYKSKERLDWEHQFDCNVKMRQWILDAQFATEAELVTIEKRAKTRAQEAKNKAWKTFSSPLDVEKARLLNIFTTIAQTYSDKSAEIDHFIQEVSHLREPSLSELMKNARQLNVLLRGVGSPKGESNGSPLALLNQWILEKKQLANQRYSTNLYSHSPFAALNVPVVYPEYSENSPTKNGYEIINTFFDKIFESRNDIFAFGEDLGHIGDVNQGFMGLQAKYGEERIFDTGIREWTIMGQAIGMSMRGLKTIAEIQYLDYIYYGLAPLADDLTSLRYRTNGLQQSPCIIRTRGHRLEGIWHSGSPMGVLVSALRGMYICVPRNFVQAAGMYNTLLQSDDPGMVVESLNGYRLKERLPDNMGTYTVPLGVPDVITEGSDVTLVTYGSCVRIAQEAVATLEKQGISVELIDVQTLLPFDLEHKIVDSLKKTNRIVFLDEDVNGGGTAYMMQEVLEKQGGYEFLDAKPKTVTAKEHRPPYGSDGDYFSKPNVEDVVEAVLEVVFE